MRGALAFLGGCPASQILLGELKDTPRNGRFEWARCPLTAVIKIMAAEGGIKIDWTRARIEILDNPPLQCHRCHMVGHVMANCRGPDRRAECYRCDRPGHIAKVCEAPKLGCPVCREAGRPDTHRLGASGCKAPKVGPRAAAASAGEQPRPKKPKKGQVGLVPAQPVADKASAMEVEAQGEERRKAPPEPETEEGSTAAPSKRRKGYDPDKKVSQEEATASDIGREGAKDTGTSQGLHTIKE